MELKNTNYDVVTNVLPSFYVQKPGKDHTRVPVLGGEASFTTDSGENSSLGSCSLGKICTVFV